MEQKSKERPYIVMEFFNGTDLFDVIEKQGALPLDDALHIMHQAAKGLQAAHANGVLHRDVKPHNLLVRKENPNENGPQWAVKLIDFGLAMQQKVSDVSTVAQLKTGSTMSGNLVDNSIAGTMEYAAPEQMGRRPEKVGKYSDAFGWAKMCCYTLFKTTQPLRSHWKKIPEDIADLLERCLTEDPKQRPKDFSEIIDVLVNYRKGNQHCFVVETSPRSSSQKLNSNPNSKPPNLIPDFSRPHENNNFKSSFFNPIPAYGGLVISGSLSLLMSLLMLPSVMDSSKTIPDPIGMRFFCIIGIPQSIFVLYAALKMSQLRNYYISYAGSILTIFLFPPFVCTVLGLPFGIKALLYLSKPQVKASFSR